MMNIPAAFTIATAEESRQIDAETVNKFGIDGFTLMEIAGSSAARLLWNKLERNSHGVFFCGKGNNGGDALVVARHLAQHQIKVTVVFAGGTDNLSPAAQKNYTLLQRIQQNDADASISFIAGWTDFDPSIQPDFIVDGMLGTGLDSDLRGDYIDAVAWVNDKSCPVFAMDIPTGLHADTGQILGKAVKATQTFAFGLLKQGFYLNAGSECCGTIHFCSLPFPDYLVRQNSTYLIDESWLPEKTKKPARHKYEAGVLHIIAGSEGLTGAGIMAAESAWAEGIGAVVLICPRGLVSVYENNLPHIIKKPVGERDDYYFKPDHLGEIHQAVTEKEGPVLIGSGIGRHDQTVSFVHQFLGSYKGASVIDADALWCLAQQSKWEKPTQADWIFTPHPGELSHLLKDSFSNDAERFKHVKKYAEDRQLTLISKGFPVIIGTPAGKTYLTGYDTRKFSRAGFGDVLAGKIGAYRAIGFSPEGSGVRALINGNKKICKLEQNHPEHIPGPNDLI